MNSPTARGERVSIGRANFGQALAQDFGQARLNFGSDEADGVHVANMDSVFVSKAGELHANEVGDRSDRQTIDIQRLRKIGHGLYIFRADFLVYKDKVHGAARFWRPCVNEHVHSGRVPKFQSERFHQLRDLLNVRSPDRGVDVPRQSGRQGIDRIDVEVYRQPTNNSVFDSGLRKRGGETAGHFN